MITTIYKCDRCGKEQITDTPKQMWNIGISTQYLGDSMQICLTKLWCRECCDLFQLIISPSSYPHHVDPPVVEITLEEKIREILRDTIREEIQ